MIQPTFCSRVILITLLLPLLDYSGSVAFGSNRARDLSDPWGINLKGNLVVVPRDEPDQFQRQFGWPRQMASVAPMWGRSPAIIDIDHNGDWEIAIVNGEGSLYIYQHDGARYPGFPTNTYRGNRPTPWEDPTYRVMVSSGDVDRDQLQDAVYSTDIGHLHVIGSQIDEPNPYPLDLTRGVRASTPVTLDINNDQSAEIILTTYRARPLGQDEALLHILDAGGNEMNGWPVRCGVGTGSSPAVGDIDGDNVVEIVIASGRNGETPGQVWAFELDGSRVNGFPAGRFESIDGSVILAPWDSSPGSEIIFAAAPFDGDVTSLIALNKRGEVVRGFPRILAGGHPFGNPIVGGAEVEGHYNTIYFGGYDPAGNARIEIFERDPNTDSLLLIKSYDAGLGVVGSVVLADVIENDRQPDVVAALAPTEDHEGRILLAQGDVIQYIDLADYGGGAFASSPTLWDLNRDNVTELIATTTDGRVMIWRTEGMFTGENWPTERGDFSRSGRKSPFQELGVTDQDRNAISPQTFTVDLYPNPFNGRISVDFFAGVTESVTVSLYDLKGAQLTNKSIRLNAGETSRLSFDAGNLNMSSGVYYVRWSGESGSSGSSALLYLP